MSRPPSERPERLLEADATAFERRVLEAALRKKPSPAASARMARALGVTAGAVALAAASEGTAAAATTKVAADATAAKAAAGAGATAAWPWVSIGVLGLVVMAGTVVGVRARRASPPEAREGCLPRRPLRNRRHPLPARPPRRLPRSRSRRVTLPRRAAAAVSPRVPVTFEKRSPCSMPPAKRSRRAPTGARWRSCAATRIGFRRAAFVPKPPRSRSKRW